MVKVKRQAVLVLVQLIGCAVLIQASTASNEYTGQRDCDDEPMVRTLLQSTFTPEVEELEDSGHSGHGRRLVRGIGKSRFSISSTHSELYVATGNAVAMRTGVAVTVEGSVVL